MSRRASPVRVEDGGGQHARSARFTRPGRPDTSRGPATIVVTGPRSSSAAAVAGSDVSASRSTQKTYSQARSRLGRDSSLRMLSPWSAKTRRTASSVPGSLRTATTSVVRRRRRRRPSSAGGGASGSRQHDEPGPVAGQVADPVGEDLEAEQRRRARRQDGGRAALAAVGDGLAGAGGVVRREELPRPRAQERLGLAERLDVRVDPLDVLEPLAGQRREAEADRHDDLAADDEVVLEQQVVVLADRAVDDVLDRARRRPRPSPAATASKTARKLPSGVRSTSPNAASTASSANAPGSPA